MKLVSLFAIFISLNSLSQLNHSWCGFDHHNELLNTQFPGREDSINQFIDNSRLSNRGDRTDPIIIPVVVHVIHDGGESNISFEQIQSAIDLLNEDFNRTNADAANTRNTIDAPFDPIAADCEISFELAKIDPNGNCTNGVQRRYNPSVTNSAGDNAKHYNQGGLDAWNRNDYMNIWVVNSIENSGTGVILGYAEFPYSGGSSNYGVIIRHDAFGTLGTSTAGERTITHEIGHCLGLYHTFQGGCHSDDCSNNGDRCCDTPPESEAHWSCGVAQNSCSDVPLNDIYGFDALDQWENFMSYAPCQNMFSEDQKAIMLNNLAGINFLSNLVSLTNQAQTGVGLPPQLCMATFSSNTKIICAGTSVNFYDDSFFNITSRTWNFSGGTPNTSSDENPIVTFNSPGIYDVSLTVSDGTSTLSSIENDYIIVLANPGESLPYSEGFESYTTFPDNQNFMVQNDDEGQTWDITSSASYSGSQSLKLKNFAETDLSQDSFISETIDLSNVDSSDPIVFTFRYAYMKRNPSNDEWLQIYVSKDCGETWALRKNIHGSQLNANYQNLPFTPFDPTEWVEVSIDNINSDYYVSNFRFKFVFTNDSGNNIYIDNINIYPESMTSIIEQPQTPNLTVYPNPANSILTLGSNENTNYSIIEIYNSLGELVLTETNLTYTNNTIKLNIEALSPGTYTISLKGEQLITTTRFIKL